ncbi:MAG TPA: DinB family protein, partial [Vicinamibacterales bacterium]
MESTDETRAALPAELQALDDELVRLEADARRLVDGLSDARGRAQPVPGAWSVSECLDHLATANRVYLEAMRPAAARARQRGRLRRGPALPGLIGRWFVRQLEPESVERYKMKSPRKIRPRTAPPLAETFEAFIASQQDVHAFVREGADLDLASVHFRNPFVAVIHFSLATGVHVIAAHERRHLRQAWRARQR